MSTHEKKKTVSEEMNRDQFADNFVCKNFVSFDLVRTFPINRWTKFWGKTRACRVQTDRFLVDARIDPKWLAIMSKETKGTSMMSPWLGYALYIDSAKLLQYVTTNPRNWSNYKAQRAMLYGNAIDTPEIERNAMVETNRDRERKRMGGVNRRERKRRRKIKDEERKIRAIHDGWTTLVYYVSVIRCSLRSIDE